MLVSNKISIFAPNKQFNGSILAITKEAFRTLIHEGQEEIRDVELYDRPFDFEENGSCFIKRQTVVREAFVRAMICVVVNPAFFR